jgi:methionyl aminopeptidase
MAGFVPERIELKSLDQVRVMRRAGLVVAEALAAMRAAAVPGASTGDLDDVARAVLEKHGAGSSFLGYDVAGVPFPAVICASLNEKIVHGVPSHQEKLNEGDLVSIDFGAIVDGWHGDAAISVEIGEVAPDIAALSEACRKSLWDGIAKIKAGGRLGDVSNAIETSIRGSGNYGIIMGYGGHGIGSSMHMPPHILNYGKAGKGPRLLPGMALAIEPMITAGARPTVEGDDGWTVSTQDGSWAAHWEHTIAILDDGPWVLTAEDGGRAELAQRGIEISALAD